MKSSIQILLDADRNRTSHAIYAAVDADLKKIADMMRTVGGVPSVHRHLQEIVARRLISAIMPSDIRIQADEVVITLFRMARDVDGRTDDFEVHEELQGDVDVLACAYVEAVQDRRRERDSEEDDRPAHPDRAAFGRGAL